MIYTVPFSKEFQRSSTRYRRHPQFPELGASALLPDLVGIRILNYKRGESGRWPEPVLDCTASSAVCKSTVKLEKKIVNSLEDCQVLNCIRE